MGFRHNFSVQQYQFLPISQKDTKNYQQKTNCISWTLHKEVWKNVATTYLLSKDLEYISIEAFDYMNNAIEEVSKLLNAYCKGMKENNFSNQI